MPASSGAPSIGHPQSFDVRVRARLRPAKVDSLSHSSRFWRARASKHDGPGRSDDAPPTGRFRTRQVVRRCERIPTWRPADLRSRRRDPSCRSGSIRTAAPAPDSALTIARTCSSSSTTASATSTTANSWSPTPPPGHTRPSSLRAGGDRRRRALPRRVHLPRTRLPARHRLRSRYRRRRDRRHLRARNSNDDPVQLLLRSAADARSGCLALVLALCQTRAGSTVHACGDGQLTHVRARRPSPGSSPTAGGRRTTLRRSAEDPPCRQGSRP